MRNLTLFSKLFPMTKLFHVDNELFAYDAKSNFLAQVSESEINQIYDYYVNDEKNENNYLNKIINNGVFRIGGLNKVVPEDTELKKIIKSQFNSFIPRKFVLEITENCSLRCKYCFFSKMENKDTRIHSSKQMSLDTAIKAIDYYFDIYTKAIKRLSFDKLDEYLKIAPPNMSWWGGEPFLNFNLMVKTKEYFESLPWELYGISHKYLTYSVVSNFTVLSSEMIDFMVNSNFYLFISLDGDKNEHDTNRVFPDGKGSFEKVIANVEKLISLHPDFCRNRVIVQAVLANNTDDKLIYDFFSKYFFENSPHRKVLKCIAYNEKKQKKYLSDNEKGGVNEELLISSFKLVLGKLSSMDKVDLEFLFAHNNTMLSEFQRLFSLENSLCFDNPIGLNEFSTLFSCPIGIDQIFVSYNGTFHMCNKSDYSYPLGNLANGIDLDELSGLYAKYLNGLKKKCSVCWAISQCKICPGQILYKKKFYYPDDNECEIIRRNISFIFKKYILLLQNEKLYDMLRDICIRDDKLSFLTYEKPVMINDYEKD